MQEIYQIVKHFDPAFHVKINVSYDMHCFRDSCSFIMKSFSTPRYFAILIALLNIYGTTFLLDSFYS